MERRYPYRRNQNDLTEHPGSSREWVAGWLERRFPGPETRAAFDKIGKGMKLAIARDGSVAKLIPDHRIDSSLREEPVSEVVCEALLTSGLLHELTEHGEPPVEERRQHEGYRMGWREVGLPGEQYRLFVCMQ